MEMPYIPLLTGCTAALVLLTGLGSYAVHLRNANAALTQQFDEQSGALAKSKQQVLVLTKAGVELRAQASTNQTRLTADDALLERLKGSIEAFARQASTCESLRQHFAPGNPS